MANGKKQGAKHMATKKAKKTKSKMGGKRVTTTRKQRQDAKKKSQ